MPEKLAFPADQFQGSGPDGRIIAFAPVMTMAKVRTISSPSPRQCSQMPAKAMLSPELGAMAMDSLPPGPTFQSQKASAGTKRRRFA